MEPIHLSTFNSNMKTVKIAIVKSVVKSLLIFSPLIFGMILINYFIDPGGVFKNEEYGKGIARILTQGLNVANFSGYDDRLLQMYYIKADRQVKDIIVLGSSRVTQINASNLDSKKFFNHSVNSASLEDFFSICEMYEQQNKFPGMIILGLDPWVLGKDNGQELWKSIFMYNYAFMNRLWGKREADIFSPRYEYLMFELKRKLSLISPSYFKQALRCLVRHMPELIKTGKIVSDYYPTQLDNLDVNTRLDSDIWMSDGTVAYGKYSISKRRENLKIYVRQDPLYVSSRFYELDSVKQQNFEKFIEYLLKKNVKVVFFLIPYHPYVYRYLTDSAQYQIIAKIAKMETYFRTIGIQNHIRVIGSYDPLQCGMTEEDFYDGGHLNREAIARLSGLISLAKTDGCMSTKK